MGNQCCGYSTEEDIAYYKDKNKEYLSQIAYLRSELQGEKLKLLSQKRAKQLLGDEIRNLNAYRANSHPQPQQQRIQIINPSPINKAKEQQLDELKRVNKELQGIVRALEKQIEQLKIKFNQKPRAAVDQNIDAFCQGKILDDDEDYKIYLRQLLQKALKRRIRKTMLICWDHQLNRNNLHEYVDGIENILIILQVQETGYKIAAWTEKAFKHPRIEQGEGLIVSLTNRIEFQKRQGKKAINYDQVFLIFGNADLRFNNDTKSLYSNLGTSTGYYENKGYKVDALMGRQQRELKLKSYEIYQLQFD